MCIESENLFLELEEMIEIEREKERVRMYISSETKD